MRSGNNNTEVIRLRSLVYKLLALFNISTDRSGGTSVDSIKLSQEEINQAVYPNNFIVGEGVNKIVVSDTAPSNPQVGDLWIDTSGV